MQKASTNGPKADTTDRRRREGGRQGSMAMCDQSSETSTEGSVFGIKTTSFTPFPHCSGKPTVPAILGPINISYPAPFLYKPIYIWASDSIGRLLHFVFGPLSNASHWPRIFVGATSRPRLRSLTPSSHSLGSGNTVWARCGCW